MHRTLLFALVFMVFSSGLAAFGAEPLYLAKDGKALCPIVISEDATPVQQTAAKELQEHLNLATGGSFEIQKESEVPEDAAQIIIGPSPRTDELYPEFDPADFKYDEILIVASGNKLILAGHEQRGPLYAVNTFLEEGVGIRWWTSTESYIPKRPTLKVDPVFYRYAPKLIYREAYYLDAFDGKFASRMKCNGMGEQIPPEYGDHHRFVYFVHSFYPLLPPEKYFDAHPEWYSEIDGKRTHDHAQLCLTNDEMRVELIKNAKEAMLNNPGAKFISISQNDWYNNCQCEKCKAIDEEEGSPSGLMLRFVNQVAEEIEKDFPDMWVETLAYQYTRKPPKITKPRHNVVVRLCTIECSFVQPLTGEQNKSLCEDIEGWNKIAPQLFVWDYVTNFSNYILPHPNMMILGANIRFFVKNGTIGLFEQGDSYCNIGDFVGLRNYMISHLMWNPSSDDEELFHYYMNNYYGKAAGYLKQYLMLIHDKAMTSGKYIGCFRKDTSAWLGLNAVNEATQLFDQAESVVKDDPVLLERVRKARMPLEHVWLLQYHDFKLESQLLHKPFYGPADGKAACEEFFRKCKEWNTTAYREYNSDFTMENYEKQLMARFAPEGEAPALCKNLPADDYIVIPETMMNLSGKKGVAQIVDDPKASNGRAVEMPGDHSEWAVQYRFSNAFKVSPKWHAYAMVRCSADAKDGTAMSLGIYNSEKKADVVNKPVEVSECSGGEYKLIDLGVHELNSDMYIWAAPPKRPGEVNSVFIDRFFFVKDK